MPSPLPDSTRLIKISPQPSCGSDSLKCRTVLESWGETQNSTCRNSCGWRIVAGGRTLAASLFFFFFLSAVISCLSGTQRKVSEQQDQETICPSSTNYIKLVYTRQQSKPISTSESSKCGWTFRELSFCLLFTGLHQTEMLPTFWRHTTREVQFLLT